MLRSSSRQILSETSQNWTQSSKTYSAGWFLALLWMILRLINSKAHYIETLASFLYIFVPEFFPYEVFTTILQTLLTSEREFRLEFAFLLSADEVSALFFGLKIALSKLNWSGSFIKRVIIMVETVYDLCQPSMFTTTFTTKRSSSFFFPFGNLSLCSRKHESDQNPERTQPGLLLGKTSRVTAPMFREMCIYSHWSHELKTI